MVLLRGLREYVDVIASLQADVAIKRVGQP